jgi:hypothetical protein
MIGYFQIFLSSVVDSFSIARIIEHSLRVSFNIFFSSKEIYSYLSDSLHPGQYGDQIPVVV